MRNYRLKNIKAKDRTLIYVVSRAHNKEFKYSSRQSINPIHWDFEKKQAKDDYELSRSLNEYLQVLSDKIEELKIEAIAAGKNPTRDYLREKMDDFFKFNTGRRREVIKQRLSTILDNPAPTQQELPLFENKEELDDELTKIHNTYFKGLGLSGEQIHELLYRLPKLRDDLIKYDWKKQIEPA